MLLGVNLLQNLNPFPIYFIPTYHKGPTGIG